MFCLLVLACICSVFADPKKPVIPESFTVDIEGQFLNEKRIIDATLYFDGLKNRAALDILSQNERTKMIYNYADNQLITLQEGSCKSEVISVENSFFSYNETDSKKKLGSATKNLYFQNSVFYSEDKNSELPLLVYHGQVDVPFYQRKNCSVAHRFTKPEVNTASCAEDNCLSELHSISVTCDPNSQDPVEHYYRFFHFRTKVDDSIFQVSEGTYCQPEGGQPFPEMPSYFAFSYDLTEEYIDDDSAKDVEILYKEVFYDAGYKLLRVNSYDSKKLELDSVHIYDFLHGFGFTIASSMDMCTPGTISDITMDSATLLPAYLFMDATKNAHQNISFTGFKKHHGLSYYVWATTYTKDVFYVVREMYFKKNYEDDKKLIPSHIEEYFYDKDENRHLELEKVAYSPIRKFRTSPKDLSVFNISGCYKDKKLIKNFELKIKVQCGDKPKIVKCPENKFFEKGSQIFNSMYANLYDFLARISGLPVTRISSLQVVKYANEEYVFRGMLLESPSMLENTIVDNHSMTISDALKNIKNDIDGGGFTFFIFLPGQGLDYRFTAKSFDLITETTTTTTTTESVGPLYGQGSMAALGIIAILIGAVIGVVALFVFLRVKRSSSVPYAAAT